VVAFSVLYSVTFLPALLSILGPRIDAGPIALPEAAGGSDPRASGIRLQRS
jgi:RND superfamily putative drug exporter